MDRLHVYRPRRKYGCCSSEGTLFDENGNPLQDTSIYNINCQWFKSYPEIVPNADTLHAIGATQAASSTSVGQGIPEIDWGDFLKEHVSRREAALNLLLLQYKHQHLC